jgi:signal transduction histidine kinase
MGTQTPRWQELPKTVAESCKDGNFPQVTVDASITGHAVFADPLLKQVFFNLFENSLMHGDHVTKIAVSVNRVSDGYDIVITDDGKGIPPADKENIFSKGFGTHTGLGLFLTREILSITGMSIRETGEFGHGARFVIHVPNGKFRQPAQ